MRRILAAGAAISGLVMGSLAFVAPAAAEYDPYIGQLSATAANYCPRDWAAANGQLIPISQNTALFSLLGTQYGGNGSTTFALPDLRGRSPIHYGQGPGLPIYSRGEKSGTTSFTLTIPQMPAHSHTVNATHLTADKGGPQDRYLGGGIGDDDVYHDGPPTRTMASNMLSLSGGNLPISHRGPYETVNWCIALFGIFPSRN
ncbi:tail Collar domain-containing protein [Aquisalinus flavus]|uniref:Tail Collar domain-containing protein n=2 Tax=Aquisalinus flavus TaxID=1526572 RepID=A0A8J2Y5F5_9PROT|nr:tail fiber protein [Aquisalinus flavus]GGC97383.1 tail Collar domain-containing protein [Aquisalinus flavus]